MAANRAEPPDRTKTGQDPTRCNGGGGRTLDPPASSLTECHRTDQDGAMAASAEIQVLVVDDQPAFRVAVRRLLAHASGFHLAGEAENAAQAVELTTSLQPDIVLMDINLPDASGVDATRLVVEVAHSTTVILLSTYPAADLPPDADGCGALAYLHKEDLSMETLRALLDGGAPQARMLR